MANYAALKAAVAAVIKTNGEQDITGNKLQVQLFNIINTLTEGYQFLGVATPATVYTAGDANVAFLAATAGTYAAMGDLALAEGEVAVLKYNGTAWSKDTALTGVAFRDGNYPSLISGAAKNLVGYGSVGAEYTRRTSGGSADIGTGAAQITKLKGKTIAWNQLVSIPGTSETKTVNGVDITDNRDGSYTINGTASAPIDVIVVSFRSVTYANDSIFLSTGGVTLPPSSRIYTLNLNASFQWLSDKGNTRDEVIFTNDANTAYSQHIKLYASTGVVFDHITIRPQMIDLTLANLADIVSTVGDFKALYPDSYGYLAGKLKNNDALTVVTTGFNRYNPETGKAKLISLPASANGYQITGAYSSLSFTGISGEVSAITPDAGGYFNVSEPGELSVTGGDSSTTCVHIVWSGYRDGEFEPYWEDTLNLNLNALACHDENNNPVTVNGLDGVGTAYDEGMVENGMLTKIIKRFGKYVFTGDETWENYGLGTAKVTTIPSLGAKTLSGTDMPNAIGSFRLLAQTRDDIYSGAKDGFSIDENNIQVSDYTKCTAGTAVEFELATPVVLTLDNPIPVSYRVDDFGTEERTSPVAADGAPSAPIVYDVQYAMNAVDTLRRLPENYISKDSAENLLEALKTAGIISAYTMTYNATTGGYDFTITAPEEPAEPAEE